jgi:hypothetical protein
MSGRAGMRADADADADVDSRGYGKCGRGHMGTAVIFLMLTLTLTCFLPSLHPSIQAPLFPRPNLSNCFSVYGGKFPGSHARADACLLACLRLNAMIGAPAPFGINALKH